MLLSPALRKLMLFLHVATSVGLLGTVACFVVFATFGLLLTEVPASEVYLVLPLLTEALIIPLLVLSLAIGILSSVATPWGIARYYWVIAKLALTTLSLVVLLFQMAPIERLAQASQSGLLNASNVSDQIRLVIHSVGGLLVLLLVAGLSIYKPRGQTDLNF